MWRLYVIVDKAACQDRDLAQIAKQAIRGGADVIQLRDKQSRCQTLIEEAARVLDVTKAAGVPLLVNDRADVALAVGAEGVHVGQDDLPVSVVRQILGPERIIGKSTHSLEQALAAEQEGADYLAVGPIYPTPTKPEYPSVGVKLIGQVKACVSIPIVAIGGIDHKTLPHVLSAGAECVAVVRAVCAEADVEQAARRLKHTIADFLQLKVSS